MPFHTYLLLVGWSTAVWAITTFGCRLNSRIIIAGAAMFWATGCLCSLAWGFGVLPWPLS